MEMDSSLFCTPLKHLWDGKSPKWSISHGNWEQNSKTSLLANFQIAVKTRCQKFYRNGLVFFLYHDTLKNARKTCCIGIGHVIRCSGILCCLCKWCQCAKRQSQTTLILPANNFVAVIHSLQYNKYEISTFLFKQLAKKVCSISFISQYKGVTYRKLLTLYFGEQPQSANFFMEMEFKLVFILRSCL